MPPMTMTGTSSAGNASGMLAIARLTLKGGPLWNPFSLLRTTTAMISVIASTVAGMMPATNSDPTDSVVIEPSTSSASDGGIVSPIAAAAASTATDSVGG